MRRLRRIAGLLLIVTGIGAVAWAFTVWQWQDPFTLLLNRHEQQQLERSFDRRLDEGAAQLGAAGDLHAAAVRWRTRTTRGEPIARIRIPAIGLSAIVVNGTDHESLRRGPGRYLGSAMPGEGKLVYIAGHRTTYGAPFSRIDRLRKGDLVTLELPYATFTYSVTGHRIVPATQLGVLESKGHEQLALQACHPRFFASHRFIAYATPVETTPRGADDAAEALG
jgi:sortase A